MWLLRSKSGPAAPEPELLPPETGLMRRIVITVDRHWIARTVASNQDAAKAHPPEPKVPGLGDGQ